MGLDDASKLRRYWAKEAQLTLDGCVLIGATKTHAERLLRLDAAFTALQKELDEVKAENEKLKKLLTYVNSKLKPVTDAFNKLEVDYASLSMQYNRLLEKLAEIESLKAELSEAEFHKRNLEQAYDLMRVERDALKAENEKLLDKLDDMNEKWADTLGAKIDRLTEQNRVLVETMGNIQSEIDKGKKIDCLGCCNGNDIPDEELCRCCWRIWIRDKGYLLWDWQTTEGRIAKALAAVAEMEGKK